jgi:hypothetical protein
MKRFVEKKNMIEGIQWNGFSSMPELVEMKGDAINILLRHDESVVIFDNGYFLDKYIIANKGDWIIRNEQKQYLCIYQVLRIC